jgi:hypothetical protein
MKKFLIFLFITHALNIKAQESKNLLSTIIGIIDNRDLKCSSEIEKAKLDFKYREAFYYIEPEGYLSQNSKRHHQILGELLQKKGIQFLTSSEVELSSYWNTDGTTRYQLVTNCYYKASNELLNLKYGSHFTKDIEKTADSLYVIGKINDVFEYPDNVDAYCIVYPKAQEWIDQKIEIQNDFFSIFKFPKGFIYDVNKADFRATTEFIIKRDDKVSDIKIKIEFKNPKNKEFDDYIIKQLSMFIENANWKAAVSNDIKINSSFKMVFYN